MRMVGEIEAAGDIATGALLGRALEPHAGEGGDGHGAICLNCSTALIGPHCHRCGQTGHLHRTLGAVGHEILHGVFHFEGKFWRTLPMLVFRPGALTRRYIAGERARFVSPMAIFLFSIFAMFAVFSLAGISAPTEIDTSMAQPAAALEAAQKDARDQRDRAAARLARTAPEDPDRAGRAARLAEAEQNLRSLDAAARMVGPDRGGSGIEIHTGWSVIDHAAEKWNKNPSLMLYKLQSSSYKYSWLLIPLSLPFLWLMFFWRTDVPLYDHAIFVTYSIAFMSLLFILLTLIAAIGVSGGWILLAAVLVPPVHIYRQLKGAYGLTREGALVRTLLLCVSILFILILFLLAIIALGAAG